MAICRVLRPLLLLLPFALLAEPPARPAGDWLAAQQDLWQTAGWTVETPLADIVVARAPGGETVYVRRLPDDPPLTRAAWRAAAVAGRRYPNPRRPLRRIEVGTMLYQGGVGQLAKARQVDYPAALEQCFANMRTLGLDSAVYCAYTTPEEWPAVEALADQYDIDLIVQYHAAYFRTERGSVYYRRQQLPKALDFLAAAHDSPRLVAFANKEEIYLPYLEAFQRTHAAIRRAYPDVPLYTLYNSLGALEASRWPSPDIVGTDVYPFLGGYYGGGRQKPSFLVPPRALRYQLYGRLLPTGREAAARGAAFTYTPDMQAGSWVLTDDEMAAQNIPRREFPGVERLANGCWLLWRRYRPPPIAIAGAVWVAAACGAEGFFPWYWTARFPDPDPVPESPTEAYTWTPRGTGAAGDPLWQAYAAAGRDFARWNDLRRQLVLDDFPRVETDDTWSVAGVFRFADDRPGHVVLLVNLDIGRWREFPDLDWNDSGLAVDRKGMLTGFTPLAEPRAVPCRLRLGPDEIVATLDDGAVVPTTAAGTGSLHDVSIHIAPASGRFLYLGPAAGLPAGRSLTNTGDPQ